jgi:hypothetical protein
MGKTQEKHKQEPDPEHDRDANLPSMDRLRALFDQELRTTFLFFLGFGVFLMLTTNLPWHSSLLAGVSLFLFLIIPGYPYSRAMGIDGFLRIGLAALLSVLFVVLSIFILNNLFGVKITLAALLIDIAAFFLLGLVLEKTIAKQGSVQ